MYFDRIVFKHLCVKFQVAVQQLYEFRDHYFEHNSTDKALLKNQETEEKLKETLNILDYVQGKENINFSQVLPPLSLAP